VGERGDNLCGKGGRKMQKIDVGISGPSYPVYPHTEFRVLNRVIHRNNHT